MSKTDSYIPNGRAERRRQTAQDRSEHRDAARRTPEPVRYAEPQLARWGLRRWARRTAKRGIDSYARR